MKLDPAACLRLVPFAVTPTGHHTGDPAWKGSQEQLPERLSVHGQE